MKFKFLFFYILIIGTMIFVYSGCKGAIEDEPQNNYENPVDPLEALKTLVVTSSAFSFGDKIPAQYTCDGAGISPPVSWANVPEGTKSILVTFVDRTWAFVHMILMNVPADVTSLPEDVANNVPSGAQFGPNSAGLSIYFPPRPDPGDHNNYYYIIYALDTMVPESESNLILPDLLTHVQDNILAWGELLGIYR